MEAGGLQMTNSTHEPIHELPPPQPRDPPGIRPPLDLAAVFAQVAEIQRRLAEEQTKRQAEKDSS